MMESLGTGYTAVVVGASGGIGGGLVRALADDPACGHLFALSRRSLPDLPAQAEPLQADILDEESIREAASAIGKVDPPPSLVVVATGYLHEDGEGPEKTWSQLDAEGLARNFAINATGPALVAKHFLPLMPRRERAIFAALSARVGSISDNRVGGWYGYRASKAALNQILKCLAIEGARKRSGLVVAGLQPGTVRTTLSEPFRGRVPEDDLFEPDTAARNLLSVLDGLEPEVSGRMFDWSGAEVPP